MLLNSGDIAKYFRESVSFDFSKETISSYSVINRYYDKFYTLVEREAFSALLNDCIGQDNQLIDIFMDIFDAELGIQKAFTGANRANITYFLNQPKYQYHKNDISKVYLAFNTWFEFYGFAPITPEWEKCPFCGKKVKNGVCSDSSCGQTTKDCMDASSELSVILAAEKEGKATFTPKYWNKIKENTEFYSEYKSQILYYRNEKSNVVKAEEEAKRRKVIDAAIEDIKALISKVDIIAINENPNFNIILEECNKNKTITEALKYDDEGLEKQYNKLKKYIETKTKEHQKKKEKEKKLQQINHDISLFMKNVAVLKQELTNISLTIDKLQTLLDETVKLYSEIKTLTDKEIETENSNALTVLKEFEDSIRPQVLDYITKEKERVKNDELLNNLKSEVTLLLSQFKGVSAIDDKSSQFQKKLIDNIEKNREYDVIRNKLSSQYEAIVSPLRSKISDLILEENKVKLEESNKEFTTLIAQIKKAQPKEEKSDSFRTSLKNILNNKFYYSVKSNIEFVNNENKTISEIKRLESEEKEYRRDLDEINKRKERLKKKKKARFIAILISVIVVAATLFILELNGIQKLPLLLDPIITEVEGKVVDNQVMITGLLEKEKNLIIPDKTRVKGEFKGKVVTSIGTYAFNGEESLETIELPETLEEIGENAFWNCSNLRRVVLNTVTPPKIYDNSFKGTNIAFYVPAEAYAAYLNNSNWSKYANFIFPSTEMDLKEGMIIFDEDGGSEVEDILSHKLSTVFTQLPSTTKYGYDFVGWYYIENGEEKMFTSSTAVLESMTLIAKWDPNPYKIIFDYDGGYGDMDEKIVRYEQAYGKLPIPTKDGYVFLGWYLNNERISSTDTVTLEKNATVVAKWESIEYKVIFDYNGGTKGIESINLKSSQKYGTLPTTTKVGYKFDGWYCANKKVDANSSLVKLENHVLVAKWTPIQYKIEYVLNGGKFEITQSVCNYGSEYKLVAPYRDGYEFAYWEYNGVKYYAGDIIKNLIDVDGKVIQFTAKWK